MSMASPASLITRLDSTEADFSAKLSALLAFEASEDEAIDRAAAQILASVKAHGDSAVLDATNRFDRLSADSVAALELSQQEMQDALNSLSAERRHALETAAHGCVRITRYKRKNAALKASAIPKPMELCSVRRSRHSIASASMCRAVRRLILHRC
jgi:histidinol dehydrogenase